MNFSFAYQFNYPYVENMMQEHPFFSGAQIYFGKPFDEEEDFTATSWTLMTSPQPTHDQAGLFFLWYEPTFEEEDIDFS